jgi:hypothetical protein
VTDSIGASNEPRRTLSRWNPLVGVLRVYGVGGEARKRRPGGEHLLDGRQRVQAAALRHRPLLQLSRNDEGDHLGAAGLEVGPALDVRLQGR